MTSKNIYCFQFEKNGKQEYLNCISQFTFNFKVEGFSFTKRNGMLKLELPNKLTALLLITVIKSTRFILDEILYWDMTKGNMPKKHIFVNESTTQLNCKKKADKKPIYKHNRKAINWYLAG